MSVTIQNTETSVLLRDGSGDITIRPTETTLEISTPEPTSVTVSEAGGNVALRSVQNGSTTIRLIPSTEEQEVELQTNENLVDLSTTITRPTIESDIVEPTIEIVETPITLTMDGALYQSTPIIQDDQIEVVCTAAESVGDCVYVSGDPIDGVTQVRTVDPTQRSKMPAVGVLISKDGDTSGRIKLFGVIDGYYTGLTYGQFLYPGTDGRLTHTPPTAAAGESIYIQNFAQALGSDRILVSPQLWLIKDSN